MSQILRTHTFPGGQRFQIVQGDLTKESVGAIVNAANAQLQHGGGVAGLIVRRGGDVIQQESDAWVRAHGAVTHADPAYTSGGDLPCQYVIHAVGPIWGEGNEDRKLEDAIVGSLNLAEKLKVTSIAFPAISTGIFGFPKERAAAVIYRALMGYYNQHRIASLVLVRLTLYDDFPTVEVFLKTWDAMD